MANQQEQIDELREKIAELEKTVAELVEAANTPVVAGVGISAHTEEWLMRVLQKFHTGERPEPVADAAT